MAIDEPPQDEAELMKKNAKEMKIMKGTSKQNWHKNRIIFNL